jgi:hypothetical protein
MLRRPLGGEHSTTGASYVHACEKFFVIAHAVDIVPRE